MSAPSSTSTLCVILAAGEGTRMKSSKPKVLHEIAGLSLVGHVLAATQELTAVRRAVVTGPDRDDVADAVQASGEASIHVQTNRLGTAHAVLAAREAFNPDGSEHVLVLFGDTPLITGALLKAIADSLAGGDDLVVVGFEPADPTGYGRLVMEDGALAAIVEERDATDDQRQITLCNSGVMGFRAGLLPGLLDRIGNDNAKGEYYLTDAVALARADGLRCAVVEADPDDVLGINDRLQLAEAEAVMQARLRARAMAGGATLVAPDTVHLSHDTMLAPDVVVEPHVVFAPGVRVERGSTVRAFSHLEGATLGEGVTIGPYARLRPGTDLAEGVKIGNFVETKNATVSAGAKINHLSYVGDAVVGAGANIGAGTITCNYDGVAKHQTMIGEGVFVGSNSALVAPVTLEDGAYIGSGSVITKNVPADSLAVARGRQRNIEGWAKLRKSKT